MRTFESLGAMMANIFTMFHSNSSPPMESIPQRHVQMQGVGQGIALKLRFHAAHGKAITLDENFQTAVRDGNYFEHGVLFSHRPIGVNESVAIEIKEITLEFCGPLRIGFSSINPNSFIDEDENECSVPLGRHLKNRAGVWLKSVHLVSLDVGKTLYWMVTQDGVVVYGMDGQQAGVLLREVDVSQPLWAVVEVYGRVKAVKFVNKAMVLTGVNRNENNINVYQSPNLTRISRQSSPRRSPRIRSRGGSALAVRRNVSLSPLQDFNRMFTPSPMNSPITPAFLSPTQDQSLNGVCIICTDKEKNTAFTKCGHLCMCYDCAVSYSKTKVSRQKNLCPVCRTPITSVLRIYF